MKRIVIVTLSVVVVGASVYAEPLHGEHFSDRHQMPAESGGEHGRFGDADQEESHRPLSVTERCDMVRGGVRLILAYDSESSRFVGTVENTTKTVLARVRVEVLLSNGVELGPTKPADLAPGAKRRVALDATAEEFDRWTAHPETGNEEHGHGHGEEHRGREHDG